MGTPTNPKIVLLFSGKRKSGKDYITDLLISKLDPNQAIVLKISAPIKSFWAKSNNLNFDHLLSASSYKEQHRRAMIDWSEEERCKDPGIFCRQAVEMYEAVEKPLWIVSDVRRPTDVTWFKESYPSKINTIRIDASEETRRKRGWTFTSGVDDEPSECGLDDYENWNWRYSNDDDNQEKLESFLTDLTDFVKEHLKS
ncbi:hypothetical protein V9T40_005581 [Parthenolecanium corni]|uniref:Phosphomevalonate kinase n=1 Tax=Parthenolecanium corni TaxID=536013 RepID=A0AAN9TSU0_9HEMI